MSVWWPFGMSDFGAPEKQCFGKKTYLTQTVFFSPYDDEPSSLYSSIKLFWLSWLSTAIIFVLSTKGFSFYLPIGMHCCKNNAYHCCIKRGKSQSWSASLAYVLPFFLKRSPSEEDDDIEKAMPQMFLPSVCLRPCVRHNSTVSRENGFNLKLL